MQDRQYIIKPLLSALAVLDVLRNAATPMRLSEISEASGTSKTTVFRYLKTFVLAGYVIHHPDNTYTLGSVVFSLGGYENREVIITKAASEEMSLLAKEFEETVNLGIPKGKRIHYAAVLEPKHPIRLRAESGDADCFHSTALGKAMIAFLDKREQDLHLKASLPRITSKTVTTRRQLDQELAKVRRFGYAIDQEENEIGCVCYAAPIFGSHGRPIAAISVSVPSGRLNDILDLHLPEKVKASAGRISESIISSGITAEFANDLKSVRGTGKKKHSIMP